MYDEAKNDLFAKYGGVDAQLLTIDLMEGHDFEYWSAGLLRKIGFTNVEVTPGSGDQGVDILAQKEGVKYAIQCKRYSSDLGNKPVQEVHAGKSMYNCHVGAVITNQHFTPGAKELAKATGVLLWDREWIKVRLQVLGHTETGSSARIEQANESDDEMLPAAVDVVLETGQASVSMLQRRLNLGYARAARIVDEMEEKGIVGPFQGAKPRTILITKDQWDMKMGGISYEESSLEISKRVTPDIDPVSDYRPSEIMVEIKSPQETLLSSVIKKHNTQDNQKNYQVNSSVDGQEKTGRGRKKKWTAFFLCLFGGMFGIHRFYVGKVWTGFLWFLTVGCLYMGWVFDIFMILTDNFYDKNDLPLI